MRRFVFCAMHRCDVIRCLYRADIKGGHHLRSLDVRLRLLISLGRLHLSSHHFVEMEQSFCVL